MLIRDSGTGRSLRFPGRTNLRFRGNPGTGRPKEEREPEWSVRKQKPVQPHMDGEERRPANRRKSRERGWGGLTTAAPCKSQCALAARGGDSITVSAMGSITDVHQRG